jgi:hypothetical protein
MSNALLQTPVAQRLDDDRRFSQPRMRPNRPYFLSTSILFLPSVVSALPQGRATITTKAGFWDLSVPGMYAFRAMDISTAFSCTVYTPARYEHGEVALVFA